MCSKYSININNYYFIKTHFKQAWNLRKLTLKEESLRLFTVRFNALFHVSLLFLLILLFRQSFG